MALGPGKYDKEATAVRESTQARGVIVIVIDGVLGSGFSAQTVGSLAIELPAMLRSIADQIESTGRKDG